MEFISNRMAVPSREQAWNPYSSDPHCGSRVYLGKGKSGYKAHVPANVGSNTDSSQKGMVLTEEGKRLWRSQFAPAICIVHLGRNLMTLAAVDE